MKLEAIRALIEAATPGPWAYRVIAADFYTVNQDDSHPGHVLADAVTPSDAALIAASRTLLPKLLAVAEAASKSNHHARWCSSSPGPEDSWGPCECNSDDLEKALTALEVE